MLRRIVLLVIVLLFVATVVLFATSHFFTDFLWFQSLGYTGNMLNSLYWQWGAGVVFWLLFTGFLFVNLLIARPVVSGMSWQNQSLAQVLPIRFLGWIMLGASMLLGFLAAAALSTAFWDVAGFFFKVPFNSTDPLFGKDISYYFFELPFYRLLLNSLSGAVFLSLLLVGVLYLLAGGLQVVERRMVLQQRPLYHLRVLAGLFFLLRGIGYIFDNMSLVYSTTGGFFGASFTDVNVRVLANWISLGVAVSLALVLISPLFRRKKLLIGVVGLWLVNSIVLGGIVPGLVQNWIVEPNQFDRERTYIANHIDMTRKAYNLDRIEERDFDGDATLSWDDIEGNWDTLQNVRLWDPRPLLQTYSQLQEMRLYYRFLDADVDRYWVNGEYRQVMLAARELMVSQIQNRTWLNEHLQYTHGYGLVMSPVNESSGRGLPEFWISDIPPRSDVDLAVDEPRIYYGERTTQYVIVNTKTEEFSYPLGDRNAFTRYEGTGGVQISNLWRRLALAIRFGSSRIILSTDLTSESRALFDRTIKARVNKIAPFLRYDQDPYLVLDEGRLFWIIDAYTVSSRYPYSQPVQGWGNYVRNSVKVIVDAYQGTVDFYQMEPDPLVEMYARLFPGWLQPLANMPEGLRAHIRYPEDYFALQASVYGTYQMTDLRVFYNREDVWTFASEVYADREQDVLPYYVVMELPEEDGPEMVLMLPFTPLRRNNMVAWLAARNDGEHYGEMIVYKFSKDSLTLGPAQVEARISQDSEISQLLTLWDQRGSQVIRGNLLVLPIGDGVLYVEPLYLQSEQSGMPQLQRVILAHQDDIVMANTLLEGLEILFGDREQAIDEMLLEPDQDTTDLGDLGNLPEDAYTLYEQAQQALQSGDFAGFGQAWERLEEVLLELIRE